MKKMIINQIKINGSKMIEINISHQMIYISKSSLSKNRTCDIKKGRNHYCTVQGDSFNVTAVNTTAMATCARMV